MSSWVTRSSARPGVWNVEAVARSTTECTDVEDIGCTKTEANVRQYLPVIIRCKDPPEIATQATHVN